MTTSFADGLSEEEFRRSIEARLRENRPEEAIARLRRLLASEVEPGGILPARFMTVQSSDLALDGWEELVTRIRAHDEPGRPITAISIAFGWPGEHRRVLGSGRDGADLALLEVLETEDIASRFTRVFIASGDHLFEPAARRLLSQGVDVQIVARPNSIAFGLWALGRNVEFPDTTAAQEIA